MDKDVLICVENYAQYRDFDHSGTRNNGIWQDLEILSRFTNKLSSKSSHIFDYFRARIRMALAKSLNFESHWKLCSIGPIEIFDHPGTGNSKIWQNLRNFESTNFAQNSDFWPVQHWWMKFDKIMKFIKKLATSTGPYLLSVRNQSSYLTAHNWQKWKSTFFTCHCYEIHREGAVGLKSSNYTLKKFNFFDFCEYVKFGTISLKIGIL